ncbi:peroxisomal biogenesis factor 3 [Odontomachus brunneus]|uniref:peroxisomal biogenesis factor 3 n=1 Tax=Odontomachus brunneus TaxID=486640 RepID=UPI0013F2835E|nr:peroxisomal biogenesis factor 3 [Odontomachus brunneus]
MLSSIRDFFKRHQRKFLIGSAIFGGIILATRYTRYKIREWQQKEIRVILERAKKQQHFEQLEKTCNQMTTSLALNIRNTIIKELDGQTIINQLKHGSADKIALWNELKVVSISRSAVIIYAYTMLVTFLKIQINLISGYMYLNQTMDNIEDYDIRSKYLQLSAYFIYEGVQKLCHLVKSKVEQVTTSISLSDKLTLRELEQIYWAITSSIFADNLNDPIKNITSYTVSQQANKDKETPVYTKIIDQTLDLLESDEVQNLTQRNIRSGFVSLMDHISEYFGDVPKTRNGLSYPGPSNQANMDSTWINPTEAINNGTSELLDINKTTIPMAKIIPIVIGQIPDKPTSKDASTDWLQCLMSNDEIKMLGANIYEAFSYKTYT